VTATAAYFLGGWISALLNACGAAGRRGDMEMDAEENVVTLGSSEGQGEINGRYRSSGDLLSWMRPGAPAPYLL
jgi:hypothetical protein